MQQAQEHLDTSASRSAWDEAQQYGIDMSGLLANLNKTVLERIRNHDRAMTMAIALQRAMADPYGGFRESSGTPD
ncbi:MAG: hypothetical protein NTZ17_07610 [Phycisphaerae bacterium]|nr:hypothetical protein [Phycisphaerae bacterium]